MSGCVHDGGFGTSSVCPKCVAELAAVVPPKAPVGASVLVFVPETDILRVHKAPAAVAQILDARLAVARRTLAHLIEQNTGVKVPDREEGS